MREMCVREVRGELSGVARVQYVREWRCVAEEACVCE